jgi:AAA-ATPase Vps4-associated protein 1
VSPEEIARIKAEWEAKEARKRKKDKDKETAAADGGASGEGKKDDEGKDKAASSSSSVPGTPSSQSVTTPTFKRYSLHRDFYAMRQAEHRRRKKAKQTQELAPRLPGAPYGSIQ